MARIITTALSAVTIIALGIVALQYRVSELNQGAGLNNSSAEAYNLTANVSSDLTLVVGNAIPRLLVVVLLVVIVVLLLLSR